MSYYNNPGYYQSYPMPQYYAQQPPQPQMHYTNASLNGKVVDGVEMVKATDVPIGGYGIFPKADFSEVYIKSWNQNGTTSVIKFKPDVDGIPEQVSPGAIDITKILEKIDLLEDKLDKVLNADTKDKEVSVNAY